MTINRAYTPGLSVHVMRRGNNRGPIFADDYDRELFLALLELAAARHGVHIHAYVLMTNHYHLIVTPSDADALWRMMRDFGREYVLRFNRRHNRIGTLWTGRYRAIAIGDERYLLTCLRYVEQNPIKDGKPAQTWSFVTSPISRDAQSSERSAATPPRSAPQTAPRG